MPLKAYSMYVARGVKAGPVYAETPQRAAYLAKEAYWTYKHTGRATGTDASGNVIQFSKRESD